jgi:hypothetical protein
MADIRIQYVHKTGTHHAHITHLGSEHGFSTVAEVIASMRRGDTYYTLENGRRADLHIVTPQLGGREYVQTYADGAWQNNLLSLPPARASA